MFNEYEQATKTVVWPRSSLKRVSELIIKFIGYKKLKYGNSQVSPLSIVASFQIY